MENIVNVNAQTMMNRCPYFTYKDEVFTAQPTI